MTAGWLALRYFGSWRKFFTLTTTLSVVGMAIAVSSLVVSMAVFSGYVSTLEQTVQDAVGHILIFKRTAGDQAEMLNEIAPLVEGLEGKTPFVYYEAIMAHKGKINGVLIEGIEPETVGDVLRLDRRLIAGTMDLRPGRKKLPRVLIGKGIAQKFGLSVGDRLNLVVPLVNDFQQSGFRPKLRKFEVAGVINFGRFDFDSRYVVMEMKEAQKFIELGNRVTGYRLKIRDPYRAKAVVDAISAKFGSKYWVRDWQDVNRNLFEAAKLEKVVLFFILMILIVAAAFNITNTLFISVVQRYRDISVLKTMGATNGFIRRIFAYQGLIVGSIGALVGIFLGIGLCSLLEVAIDRWQLIPAEVYKLDRIELEVRALDLLLILVSSTVICYLATWFPSRRGSRISPVEGLRYE